MFIFFNKRSYKCSPYSITERRVPELVPVLGSQPAGDVSHKLKLSHEGAEPDRSLIFKRKLSTVTMAPRYLLYRVTVAYASWFSPPSCG